jgi:hypothetical protein
MTVRYALSRRDVARGYFYGWRYSSVFRGRMVILLVLLGALSLVSPYLQRQSLDSSDFATGAIWAVSAIVLMPVFMALTAKTEERVLALAADGIRTSIGQQTGTLPWSTIAFVRDAGPFVLIGRTSMNLLLVPSRAFVDRHAREEFITEARAWAQRRAA